jgi:hypothetical protein
MNNVKQSAHCLLSTVARADGVELGGRLWGECRNLQCPLIKRRYLSFGFTVTTLSKTGVYVVHGRGK